MTRAFSASAGVEVSLGQLLLRGGQRRVEIAVDADLDQPEQRREMARRLLQEALQAARRLAEVAGRGGVVDQEVDDGVARVGRREMLAERGDFLDRLGRRGEEAHEVVAGGVKVVELEQDLAAGEQQLRILAAVLVSGRKRLARATSSRPSAAFARRSDTSVAPGSRLTTSSSSASASLDALARVELLGQRQQVAR